MAASVLRKLFVQSSKLAHVSKCPWTYKNQHRGFSFSKCLAARFYTDKHEWVVLDGKTGTVGISDYAQDQLGEIVYVETPEIGTVLEQSDIAGCLESVKAASEIYSPIGGKVTEVNTKLEDEPGLVNSLPLSDGWLYKLETDDPKTDGLMDEAAYKEFVGSLEEH